MAEITEKQSMDCIDPDLLVAIPAYLEIMGGKLKNNNFMMLSEAVEEIKNLRGKVSELESALARHEQ